MHVLVVFIVFWVSLFDYITKIVLLIVKISPCVIRLDSGLFKYAIQTYFDKYLFMFQSYFLYNGLLDML